MRRHFVLTLSTLFLLAACLWVTQASADTDISWSERPLAVSVVQGSTVSASAQVSINTDLTDVYLEIVPEIADMVTVIPDHFDVLQAGETRTIDFLISPPVDKPVGVYEGTLHFRIGTSTLALPLEIVIQVLPNHQPVADAGKDLNGLVDALITLNGDGSYDLDGDLITYAWSVISAPTDSTASLTDADQYNPSITPDLPGDYQIQLIVNDGKVDSEPDTVTLTIWADIAPPNADAGADQQVQPGVTVTLDGSGSNDPQELPLTYQWSFSSVATGSTLSDADISLRDTAGPYFVPDVEGTYILDLLVNNGTATDTDSVQVIVAQPNLAPVANAGPDRFTRTGSDPGLDGNASYDPDIGPAALSYSWTLVSRPATSTKTSADITSADTATPGFIPDVVGSFVLRLEVSDGDQASADSVVVKVEDTPPVISVISPLDGSTVITSRPDIIIEYNDNESGIDPASFSCVLNGTDISSDFNVGPTSAVLQPTFDLPLDENLLIASIQDQAGNLSSAQATFNVAYFRAIPGATPVEGNAPLTVYFSTDAEDPNGTVEIFRWDFEGDGVYNTYDTVARDYTYTYKNPGTYNATLHVRNNSDEWTSASIEISVLDNPPIATADVIPSNGEIPLTVTLQGTGSDPDGTIVLYEWDYEGDGTFDWSSTTTGSTTHDYAIVGTFTAVFRVTDNSGQTATAVATTTTIRTGPPGSPTATASATPTSGNAPLTVSFTGSATDPDNNVVLYEWDFENDGVFDYSSPTSGSTSHVYTQGGTHVATFKVTDATGLTGIDQVLITVNIQASLSVSTNTVGYITMGGIQATATASSQYSSTYSPDKAIDGNSTTRWQTAYGDTPNTWIEITFNDLQQVNGFTVNWYSYYYRMTVAKVELFDGAGNLLHSQDETFGTANSHQVSLPGVENVKRLRLSSSATYRTYVLIREFNFDMIPMQAGGQPEPVGANINTSISAGTQISILIKNEQGEVVRTLVNNESRTLGSYQDYWDARDDNGVIVNDGLYYAVMHYLVNGLVRTVDLTYTTGGTRYSFPLSSGCNTRANFASKIYPFEDDFLELNFTLCTAQEVTMFIGPLWTGGDATRIRTIASRQPFPAGTHTLLWDGLDDDGNIAVAPPGDSLITGAWRYTLPNNAMMMTGYRPVIGSVAAEPNYFSPYSEKCDDQGRSEGITLKFSVSEAVALVEFRVYSVETGALVRRFDVQNIPAGNNTLFWDGRNYAGEYVDIGDYQVGVIATDAEGNTSMMRYTLVRVDY